MVAQLIVSSFDRFLLPAPIITVDGSSTIIWLSGEQDIAVVEALRAALRGVDRGQAGRPEQIVVDLGGVTFIDSSTTRALIDATVRPRGSALPITLRSPSPCVRRMLDICRRGEPHAAQRPTRSHGDHRSPDEDLLGATFAQLTDSLVDDFDIVELLTLVVDRSTALLDVQAAGILLADTDRNLRVMAASSEQARLLELFQLQNVEGPCLEAHATGRVVVESDLRSALERWPRFTPYAVGAGFESVVAVPLRLHSLVIGALNLFRATATPLTAAELSLAQALADVASIAIVQHQAARQERLLADQLQRALHTRVAIEQAKGMIAEGAHVDMDRAFELLRQHARSERRLLADLARDLVSGATDVDTVVAPH